MKPLTIEELKALEVGDWVWLIDKVGDTKSYWSISENTNQYLLIYQECYCFGTLNYSDYGTKWLAYKNKEQAEAKGEIVEIEGTCEHCVHNIQKGCYNNGINIPDCVYMSLSMEANDYCSKFEAERRLKELKGEE